MSNLHSDYKRLPFYKCERKFADRKLGIIDTYREIFNRQSVPKDQQYWCVCAQQCDENNPKREPGSECMQMIDSGLITPEQWRGVDWEEDLIELNKSVYPEISWTYGELRGVMAEAWRNESFNPAIINCDLLTMKKKSCTIVAAIISMLLERDITNCMLVMNSVLSTWHHREAEGNAGGELQDHIHFLSKDLDFAIALIEKNWTVFPKAYSYPGTKGSASTMGSIVIYRKEDQC